MINKSIEIQRPVNKSSYLDENGIYHFNDESDDDLVDEQIFEPENRSIPKTYSTQIDRVHPKIIERNISQKIVEFDEYNETTKTFATQFMVGNISTEVLRVNLSSFIIDDKVKISKKHHSISSKPAPLTPTSPPSPIPTSHQGKAQVKPQVERSPPISTPIATPTSPHLRVEEKPRHQEKVVQKQHQPEEPPKKMSTIDPVPHASHDHYEKHMREALKSSDLAASKIVFIGDSCLSQISRDASVREALSKYHPLNLASPGFRTEHMLYRLLTSNIHMAFNAPLFVIMIGTFNIGIHDSPEATKEGILTIVNTVLRFSGQNSTILVCSILPRHSISLNKNIDKTNVLVEKAIQNLDQLHFVNLDKLFKGADYPKKLLIDANFMPDHLHPSEAGYHIILNCLKPFLMLFDSAIEKAKNESAPPHLNLTKTIVDTLI